jgi:nickel transport protein
MKNQDKFILIFALFLSIFYPQKGESHGAIIDYKEVRSISIKATYDNGIPIKNGQVTVYSPSDAANSWLTGSTNDQGEFLFVPDYSVTGNWQVKVRQAGHGSMINIAINQEELSGNNEQDTNVKSVNLTNSNELKSSNSKNADYTIQQKLVMAGFGIWGCVGTAFYFSKKKAEQ